MTNLLPPRMQSKIRIERINGLLPDPCWTWTAATNSKGYSCFGVNGKSQLAHRVSYEIHKGEIPTGLEIDHLCRNTRCINPAHLEAVTPEVNRSRRVSVRRTYCLSGLHKLYGDRRCREAERIGREKSISTWTRLTRPRMRAYLRSGKPGALLRRGPTRTRSSPSLSFLIVSGGRRE